ncbi:MAG: hypothetical protein ACFFE8_06470 [Candidatus Heimdallarchaeota archaeon]
MVKASVPFLEMISNVIFGDYTFFNEYSFEEYFRSRYRMDKTSFYGIIALFIIALSLILTFQFFIFYPLPIELLLLEICLAILILRLLNFIIYGQFKQHSTMIETLGYFVVNELLMILETSGSLKEATMFIIHGNYSVFSQIFEKALLKSHFGESLEIALKGEITKRLHGSILHLFSNIISIWVSGRNLASFSKNHILNQITVKAIEEIEKIDSLIALSSGLALLSPPVLLCLLLITGLMNYLWGGLIIFGIIIVSFIVSPNRYLTLFSEKNRIAISNDSESIQMLLMLAENLMKGNNFEKSLNSALNTVAYYKPKNAAKSIDKETNNFNKFLLRGNQGIDQKSGFIREFLSERAAQLVTLTQKFSKIDPYMAGEKLLIITEELSRTSQILNRGEAKRKAADLQTGIIQLLSIISLAIIGGASPFFLYVSTSLSYSFMDLRNPTLDPSFDILFLIIALVMSVLPARRSFLNTSYRKIRIYKGRIITCFHILLFLVIFFLVRTFFLSTFLLM